MKNFSLKLLLLPLSFLIAGWLLNTTPAIGAGRDRSTLPAKVNSTNCDLPAPTNFHVVDIGYDYISVEWDHVALAQNYYVEARTSSGGQLVYSATVSGNYATLQTGPGTFDLKVAAIGPGCLVPSNNSSGISAIKTLIIDLIANGKAEPENTQQVYPDNNGCFVKQVSDGTYWFRAYYENNLISTFEINWDLVGEGTETGCDSQPTLPVTLGQSSEKEQPLVAYIHENDDDLIACAKGRMARIKEGSMNWFDLTFSSLDQFCVQYHQDPELYSYSIWKLSPPPPPLPPGGNSLAPVHAETTPVSIQNPFDADILVRTSKPAPEPVRFQLFNLNGTRVFDQQFPASQEYNLPTAGLPPGFYLLRMESDGVSRTYKVVKAR